MESYRCSTPVKRWGWGTPRPRPARLPSQSCRPAATPLPTCRDTDVWPMHLIEGPSAWVAADYQRDSQAWTYTLTAQDLLEVEAACEHVERLGLEVQVGRALRGQLRPAAPTLPPTHPPTPAGRRQGGLPAAGPGPQAGGDAAAGGAGARVRAAQGPAGGALRQAALGAGLLGAGHLLGPGGEPEQAGPPHRPRQGHR
jgi:hypothetical protein